MAENLAIETNMLTKSYGAQTAVNNVNLHVKQGRVYGLLGRNGAGKTTTMKMILGLTSVTSGEISLFGDKLQRGNAKTLYPRIASIVETPGFYPNLTAAENLRIFAKLRGITDENAIRGALEVVNLPHGDKKKFASYSLGMKQRLGIAKAVLSDPDMMILDEPTNGLDPIGIAEIRAFIRKMSSERGKTVLISSHILPEIALMADDIGIIDGGNLLEENSLAELEKKTEKYVSVQVSSVDEAVRVLREKAAIDTFSIEADNTIRINGACDTSAVNMLLVQSGIGVSSLQTCGDSLEDYFKKITGGVGIA
jgi:ABC-type multidrug transport system, ATPase component